MASHKDKDNVDQSLPKDGDSWENAIENRFAQGAKSTEDTACEAVESEPGAIPVAILQPAATEDSNTLINLDSTDDDSAKRSSSEAEGKDQDESPWLSVVASSSSKGSQGSYADQVPALSASASTNNNNNMDAKRSDLGSPWTLPEDSDKSSSGSMGGESPKEAEEEDAIKKAQIDEEQAAKTEPKNNRAGLIVDTSTSTHTQKSKEDTPVDHYEGEIPGMQPSRYSKNTMEDLDDILGSKGQDPPKSPSFSSTKAGMFSNRTERSIFNMQKAIDGMDAGSISSENEVTSLKKNGSKNSSDGGLLAATQKELDGLTSNQTQTTTPGPSPSLEDPQEQNLNSIVAGLQRFEESSTRPRSTDPTRRHHIGPASSNVSRGSTFESCSTVQEQDTFWSGNTFSDVGTTFSREDTLSPGGSSVSNNESFSRNDTLSPRDTLSLSGTSVSRSGTLSPTSAGPSIAVSISCSGTAFSNNENLSHRNTLSPASISVSHGGAMSPSSHTNDVISTSSTVSCIHTMSPAAADTSNQSWATSSERVEMQANGESEEHQVPHGGRLWQLANEEARKRKDQPISPEASRFAESLMSRTRSRADTDAVLIAPSISVDPDSESIKPNMIRISDQDDIVHTAVARKRVRVVQLLIVGLVALLIAFLGGLWVQSSCHFVTASVEVGQNDRVFDLHYGLWKYSPIDSAFQGYSYCHQYDDEYTSDAPLLPRVVSCAALVFGAFALCVLWAYLIFGIGKQVVWSMAVFSSALSGALQLSTLYVFAGPVCQRDECSLGPAGVLSVVASMVYFILAFEMHYNTPMAAWVTELASCPSNEQPGNLMANLEMTDFKDGAKAYVSRIVDGDANPYPSLNKFQRDNENPIGEAMFDRDFDRSGAGAYKPPALIV